MQYYTGKTQILQHSLGKYLSNNIENHQGNLVSSTMFNLQMFTLEFSSTSYFYGNLESSKIQF